MEISYGPDRYYRYRGYYFRRTPSGFLPIYPPLGLVVTNLPDDCVTYTSGSTIYYQYGNAFYRQVPEGYAVVQVPEAADVETPSVEEAAPYSIFILEEREYYYRDGQFFRPTEGGLVWVVTPMEALTAALPAGAVSMWFDEIEFFLCDGIYLRKTPKGYKVVPNPAPPPPETETSTTGHGTP